MTQTQETKTMETIAAGSGKGFTVELVEKAGRRYVYVNGEQFTNPMLNNKTARIEYTRLLRQYTGQ
jgi:hypothetical protein